MISFSNVYYVYNKKSPLEFEALKNVNLTIKKDSFTAIVGRTGCGKSTLIQHMNALLNPSQGKVEIEGFNNDCDKKNRSKNIKELRKKVGLVFQFPEYQLFEESVEKDVAFGPKNFGEKEEEALSTAHEALKKVGLGEEFYKRSPFELSGGEKRRVAIAGILAMHPDYLIVDEPTAGLDPSGAKEMMSLFKSVHENGTTIVLVTHDMNIVLDYASNVIVMDEGKVVKECEPMSLFHEDIEKYSLDTPLVFKLVGAMKSKGYSFHREQASTLEDLADLVAKRKKA